MLPETGHAGSGKTNINKKRKLRLLVYGCKDPGSRNVQQDAYLTSDPKLYGERGLMAVVADGMGGMSHGERYSSIAVEEMVRFFTQADPEEDLCETLLKAYQAARAAALQSSPPDEGGATVVSVLIRARRCAFLSVGDSRIYLLRNHSLIQLNREQTLGIQLDESAAFGYIPPEEAQYNMYRGSLTNHLCTQADLPCDRCTQPILLRGGDKIALMSDGVFGTLDDSEITRFLQMPGTTGAEAMLEEIRTRNKPKQDNCSVVILALEPALSKNQGGVKR